MAGRRNARLASVPAVLVLLALAALAPPALARDRDPVWTPPVDGRTLTPFTYDRAAPFLAGRHRGVDLASRPRQVVRSPCAGRVTFAGRVPGRGRAVTVRCGALAATLLELGSVTVRRGAGVGRGRPVATAATTHVHLGARRAADRRAYLDPLALIAPGGAPRAPVPAAGPRGGWPREVPPPPAPAPLGTPAPRVVPSALPASPPDRVPLVAWAGLALLAAGTPAGAWWRRRRGPVGVRGGLAPSVADAQ
jgi:hypothetical protein